MTEAEATIEVLNKLGKHRNKQISVAQVSIRAAAVSKKKVVFWSIKNCCDVIRIGDKFKLGYLETVPKESELLRGFDLLNRLAERYPKIKMRLAEPMDED